MCSLPTTLSILEATSGEVERWHCLTSSSLPRRPLHRQVSGGRSCWNELNGSDPPSIHCNEAVKKSTPSRWSSGPALGRDLGLPEHPDRSAQMQGSASSISIGSVHSSNHEPQRHEVLAPRMPRGRRAEFTRSASTSSMLSNISGIAEDGSESSLYEPCQISGHPPRPDWKDVLARSASNTLLISNISMSSKHLNLPAPCSLPRKRLFGKSAPSRWSSSPTLRRDLGLPERPNRSAQMQRSASSISMHSPMRETTPQELLAPRMPHRRRGSFKRSASTSSILSNISGIAENESESSVYEPPPRQISGPPPRPVRSDVFLRSASNSGNISMSSKDLNLHAPPPLPHKRSIRKSAPSRWLSSPSLGRDLGLPERPDRSARIQRSASNISVHFSTLETSRQEMLTPRMPKSRRAAFTRSASTESMLSNVAGIAEGESESSVYFSPLRQCSGPPPTRLELRDVFALSASTTSLISNISMSSIDSNTPNPPSIPHIGLSDRSTPSRWSSSPVLERDLSLPEPPDRRVQMQRSASSISIHSLHSSTRETSRQELFAPNMSRGRRAAFTRSASTQSMLSNVAGIIAGESESLICISPPRQCSGSTSTRLQLRDIFARSTSNASLMSNISLSNVSISSADSSAYEPPRPSLVMNRSSRMVRAGSFLTSTATNSNEIKVHPPISRRDLLSKSKSISNRNLGFDRRPVFSKAASTTELMAKKLAPHASPSEESSINNSLARNVGASSA
jgi:hypothetical protein